MTIFVLHLRITISELITAMTIRLCLYAAINQYFDGLVREGVLYGDAENTADIDVNAQRAWLVQKI